MNAISQNPNICTPHLFDISEDDILEAMKDIHGYVDITPGHFKELYGTEKNISRVPVTDKLGKLKGIVAKADIAQLSCLSSIKTGDEKSNILV